MEGAYVNDVKAIKKLGIRPHELSVLVSSCLLFHYKACTIISG
jgi:hypothetical protein